MDADPPTTERRDWVGRALAAGLLIGAPTAAYVADEVPFVAVVMALVTFALLFFRPPALEHLGSLAFRGLFFGVFLEMIDAVWGDSAFGVVRALLLALAYAVATAAWERFVDAND